MEIRASQRREPSRPPPPLHRKLARRRAWQQRLVYGGGSALAASLAAWLAGATLPLHLGAVALAFALGLGWRFRQTDRRAERWAFSWIEARSGLAYLSAHELPDTATDGLAGAVRARAAQAGTLDTPPLQPWALPLLVLALVFALAPHLALPALRAPFGSGTSQPNTLPGNPPTSEGVRLEPDATTQDATTNAANEPADGAPTDPNTAEAPQTALDAERSFDTATGAEPGEAGGEQAALDRFLEETEDAEVSPTETQRGPTQSAAPTGQAQRRGEPGEPGQGDETRPGTASPDAAPGADPSTDPGADAATEPGAAPDPDAQNAAGEGERTETGPSSQEPGEGAENGEAPQSGEPEQSGTGEEGDAPEGEAPNDQPGEGEAESGEGAPGSEQQGEPNGTGETAEQGGGASSDAEATRDIQDGQSSERGGNRGGADVAGSRERLGRPQSAPERITGIRGEGPTTAGGEALQQGQTPDTLPRTGTPESYRRAAEEVIREGRIPLEYQELIRDYFR